MEDELQGQLMTLNQLYKEQDNIYHSVAAHFGMSDAAFWVLYAVCESKETYSQNDLCHAWYYSKQTINSAISALKKMNFVELKQVQGTRNRKLIRLTKEGRTFCQASVIPLFEAECRAFEKMGERERKCYLTLFQRNVTLLKEEIQTIMQDKSN